MPTYRSRAMLTATFTRAATPAITATGRARRVVTSTFPLAVLAATGNADSATRNTTTTSESGRKLDGATTRSATGAARVIPIVTGTSRRYSSSRERATSCQRAVSSAIAAIRGVQAWPQKPMSSTTTYPTV